MSTSSFDSVFALGVTRMSIPIGATSAIFLQPIAGQVGWMLKMMAGQTAEIYPTGIGSSVLNLNFGTTQTQAFLAGMSAQGFLIGGSTAAIDVLQLGPAAFYLGNSAGATVQVYVLSLRGSGY